MVTKEQLQSDIRIHRFIDERVSSIEIETGNRLLTIDAFGDFICINIQNDDTDEWEEISIGKSDVITLIRVLSEMVVNAYTGGNA